MDNNIKLILIPILLVYSTVSQSAWTVDFKGTTSSATSSVNRRILADMKRTVTASQYKTINNFPPKSCI